MSFDENEFIFFDEAKVVLNNLHQSHTLWNRNNICLSVFSIIRFSKNVLLG